MCLLVVITARKALDIKTKEKSPEHGGVWVFTDLADAASGIHQAVGTEPSSRR